MGMGQMGGMGMGQMGGMGMGQMGGMGMVQMGGMSMGQMGGMGQMEDMGCPPGMGIMRGSRQRRPNGVEDRQVIFRHKNIYPTDEELDTILNLVDITERALKKVSDKFTEGSNKDEKQRDVVGVARVADLAKGLLLTGDKEVQLVVMCSNKPTVSLLNKITETLKPELQEELEGKLTFDIYLFPEESCFCVTSGEEGSSDVPYQIKVVLTSTQHRNQELKKEIKKVNKEDVEGKTKVSDDDIKEEDVKEGEDTKEVVEEDVELKDDAPKDDSSKDDSSKDEAPKDDAPKEDAQKDETPADLLPIDKCLDALAELRHAKWFTAMATPLTSCVETIRILRDLAQRETAWAPLGGWVTELLVERCLFSSTIVLSPSNCLLRVMEAVASGLFLLDGPSLRDPCERDEIDVASHLSGQEREDLTKYAMDAVRKIHFRKIHEILGIDRMLPRSDRWGKKAKEERKKEADVEVKDRPEEVKVESEVDEKSISK